MYNDWFSIGPLTVHGYGVMMALAILVAVLLSERRLKKEIGMTEDQVYTFVFISVLGGFLFSKILFWITILPDIIKNPSIMLDIGNGWVVYGAVLGGILCAYLYCKKHKLPFIKMVDIVLPYVALAQGIGRIGCLLAGCCYGVEHESFPYIIFNHSDFAPNHIHLFPTQIISSLLNFLNFGILTIARKWVKKDGQIGLAYLTFYSIGRFFIEFYRGDLERGSIGILSTSQFISIIVFILSIILYIYLNNKNQKES